MASPIQHTSLYQRLNEEAQRRREKAKSARPGIDRQQLLRQSRQAKNPSHIGEWLKSQGLREPT
jgi:hypothetical protein